MTEDTGEQSCDNQIRMIIKYLRTSVWKNFGFFTLDDEMTNKENAVWKTSEDSVAAANKLK